MRNGAPWAGYTIVETMIFLAISGALLASAILLISGQQQKTQFTTDIRDFDSKLQDIINNISTGYYSNTGNIKCQSGTPPILTINAIDLQGKNTGCIYIGQTIQFTKSSLNIFSMAGNRLTTVAPYQQVGDLVSAWPMAIANGTDAGHNGPPPPSATAGPDSTEIYRMNSLEVQKVVYFTGPIVNNPPKTDAIGFFTTFVPYSSGNLQSGTTGTQVIALTNRTASTYTTAKNPMVNIIDDALRSSANFASSANSNLQNGIKICLKSLGTDQYAVESISGGGSTTTKVDIYKDLSEANTKAPGVCS